MRCAAQWSQPSRSPPAVAAGWIPESSGARTMQRADESVKETNASTEAVPRRPDPIALAQLWADQFQHLTTLGVAGAGGVLILLQAHLVPQGGKWWLALGLFAA